MSRNMSNLDRGLRTFLVAPIAIILAVVIGVGSIVGIVLFALAAIMLATSAVGFCPLYTLFHIDTRGRREPLSH
jgi:Protein of unknown function (DUF2892)